MRENPNVEIRNPKETSNPESETPLMITFNLGLLMISSFEILSNFALRVSDFLRG